MDLIGDYAFPLPVLVLGEMLGIPSSDRNRLRAWTNALLPDIQLAVPRASLERRPSAIVRGVVSIPVTFSPQ